MNKKSQRFARLAIKAVAILAVVAWSPISRAQAVAPIDASATTEVPCNTDPCVINVTVTSCRDLLGISADRPYLSTAVKRDFVWKLVTEGFEFVEFDKEVGIDKKLKRGIKFYDGSEQFEQQDDPALDTLEKKATTVRIRNHKYSTGQFNYSVHVRYKSNSQGVPGWECLPYDPFIRNY